MSYMDMGADAGDYKAIAEDIKKRWCCNKVWDCQDNALHEKDCPKEQLHSCYTCGMKGDFIPYSSNGRDCIPCQEKEYDLMIERKHHGEVE